MFCASNLQLWVEANLTVSAVMYRPWVLDACILIVECHRVTCGRHSSHRFATCLQFSRFLPSRWELKWLRNAHRRQKAICGIIDSEKPNSKIWLEGFLDPALIHINMTEASDLHFNESVDAVWPLYIYHDTCSWKREDIYVPIEPVVGLLRNPMATPCSSRLPALDVQDRDYLLVATKTLTNHFTGKKLFFDLGTGDSFQSSLNWFVEKYHDRSIEFDEIWAWEAEQTDPHHYWQSVPNSYVSRLHFYNTFASDQRSLSSPIHWATISKRRLCRHQTGHRQRTSWKQRYEWNHEHSAIWWASCFSRSILML